MLELKAYATTAHLEYTSFNIGVLGKLLIQTESQVKDLDVKKTLEWNLAFWNYQLENWTHTGSNCIPTRTHC